MTADLRQQLDRLEDQRAALVSQVEGMADAALNLPPAEGKWSIIQIMSHLIAAEKLSLAGIHKKMADRTGLKKAGLAGRVRSAFLHLVMGLPVRIKAPARALATVPEHQDLETVRRQWDEVRGTWGETIDSFPPELADQGIFRHPIMGTLSLAQALRFTADHIDHHAKQIERIVRDG